MQIKRNPDLEKYKQSMQFVIDGWAACKVAAYMADETGLIGTKHEFNEAIKEYMEGNPALDIRDFGYMYILLKRKGFPDAIIEDVSRFFERAAFLNELIKAYEVRS